MPRLLDLFCGAGGCSVGYARAGFEVTGVDLHPQPNYPFTFHQGDALDFLRRHGDEFDVIHASPPCQRYTVARTIHDSGDRHPDLVAPCRDLLVKSGKPWVIENVPGAPLSGIVLCGLMFDLQVIRHRIFESSVMLFAPPHRKHPPHLRTGTQSAKRGGKGNGFSTGEQGLVCVAGKNFCRVAGAKAMGVDWHMTRKELANAIPPVYTEYLGRQLIEHLKGGK